MGRTASTQKLSRILALVPWVLAHPEQATVDAVCARFNVDRSELLEDLDLLFICGKPPFEPGDLIEAGIENDYVVIRMADYLARPLRLTRWEALTLLAAGRALRHLPGLDEPAALSSALDKLARAIAPGEEEAAALLAERVAIELEPPPPEIIDALRRAIEDRQTIAIEYYSFGRDELTVRDVDPLLVFGSRPWYLLAFDHRSKERRTFRVDRIRSTASTAATGSAFQRPEGFDPVHEAEAPMYHPGVGDMTVVIEVAPAERWVAEITPSDSVVEQPDGWTKISLRAGSISWLARLGLQLGQNLRVVEPVELRDEIARLARQALARYGG